MSLQMRQLQLGGVTYPVVLSQNAKSIIESYLGVPQEFLRRWANGQTGMRDVQVMLLAVLEGGRMKTKRHSEAFTFEAVGDLIDELDDTQRVQDMTRELLDIVLEGYQARFKEDPTESSDNDTLA